MWCQLRAPVFLLACAYRFLQKLPGHKVRDNYRKPLPQTYIEYEALPDSFTWGDVDGVSYLTHSLNQHLPQYCGSCWAHGALSSLADRIKIARNAEGDDINLSIQYILNCGTEVAGSCYGGYHTAVFEFIKDVGYVPYDTCMPYMACSADSDEGFCAHVDTTCHADNVCRTCDTFGTTEKERNNSFFCVCIYVGSNVVVVLLL